MSLSLPDNLGKFRYVAGEKDNVITMQYVFKINRDYFLDSESPCLKQLYNLIISNVKRRLFSLKQVPLMPRSKNK